jgi:hypothetical protein
MSTRFTYIQNYVAHNEQEGTNYLQYYITVTTPISLDHDIYDYQYGPIIGREKAMKLADKIASDQNAPVENLCSFIP